MFPIGSFLAASSLQQEKPLRFILKMSKEGENSFSAKPLPARSAQATGPSQFKGLFGPWL